MSIATPNGRTHYITISYKGKPMIKEHRYPSDTYLVRDTPSRPHLQLFEFCQRSEVIGSEHASVAPPRVGWGADNNIYLRQLINRSLDGDE